MRLREFAPSPDRDDNDDVPDQLLVLANRWWNATDRQPQIEHVLNSLGWSIHQVESEDDAVQLQHRDGTTHFISADDFDPDLFEYSKPKSKRAHRAGIELEAWKDGLNFQINATAHGRELGRVLFDVQYQGNDPVLVAKDLMIHPEYRGQGIAAVMYDYAKELGYYVERSSEQTDAGKHFWDKNRGKEGQVWETELNEISDELRRSYLDRAGKHVDRRLERIARVRDRLNKGYEIYHADRPAGSSQIVDRFEADTPALAQRYYEKFIRDYVSDVDFDLRLRRATGIMEARVPRSIEGFLDSLNPDDVGVEEFGAYRVHFEGFTDDCQSSRDYRQNPDAVYDQVFADFVAREGGRKPLVQDMVGDERYPILYSIFKIPRQVKEIARIPQGDFGDADTLTAPKYDVKKKELPGGAGFTYAVGKPNAEDLEIMIFDGDTLAAELDLFYTRDATKAWRVNTVAVNPEYRSRGLGKALYGIALSILKLTLEAGDTQTKHGQRMWLMLNSIPGVEVMGYNMEPTGKYKARPGDDIIAQNKDWIKYTFPVRPGTNSMRSARHGTGMYTSQASMIAKWTGQ